ncbi:hypothetical protein PTTG_12117 [Puccinia triticina 1-1 BBBD Race 1]|uniref:Uncharacterized protein n=2 Tax=Puccinia triticina TaxID=208348 RepID=A0A180GRT6_PUCT1|nr:uncharacterized protein PtA15_6A11 [Puccinia triticina]OAV95099.1 hypothetical protein PTTG_12117 [Puccinia triticina 1-1 BBBD Race 1]WAQ85383.1 hypothetical protein PtA15_6A11 [Puccinia triticina]WAR55273.1 hypothetical protein PtB15_6B12 [Puccinia triticina]
MTIAQPPLMTSDRSDSPIPVISPTIDTGQTISGAQSYISPYSASLITGHQINMPTDTASIPRSPIVSNQFSTAQPKLAGSASQLGSSSIAAGPMPEKVGEIGYVPPAEPTLPPNLVTRDFAPQTELGVELSTPSQFLRPVRSAQAWSPTLSGSYHGHGPTRPNKPRERITPFRMFFKPVLLAAFGVIVISLTFVGLAQVQERINNNNKNNRAKAASSSSDDLPNPSNHDDTSSGSTVGSSNGGGNNNASFVYIGTFFIVALLVEIWIFVGALRRLYHRLGLWVDQEYSTQLPDLSDPEATFPPPVLPLWAKFLGIKPQAVRRPLLPSYMAVLGIIRNGGRSGSNAEGTGDAEDSEVIRTLAIGQGQAAPAFNGEEFQRSTVILRGPPKRNSTLSNSPSVRSGGLLRSLSRTFTGGFSHSNSTSQTNENGHPTNANRRVSVASVMSHGRRMSGAHMTIPEARENSLNEHSTTIELSEVPLTHNAAYLHHLRRAN